MDEITEEAVWMDAAVTSLRAGDTALTAVAKADIILREFKRRFILAADVED